ncbi:hypothetical protein ES703_108761 [subsurface metagenome]
MIVPLFVPLTPDDMESQLLPLITSAIQDMVPVPALLTSKVVWPLLLATLRLFGVTERDSKVATVNCHVSVLVPAEFVALIVTV